MDSGYLRAPLERLPGLAVVCRVAFFEKARRGHTTATLFLCSGANQALSARQLPPNWREIRADSWHQQPPPDLPIGEDRMVYLHAASGRLHSEAVLQLSAAKFAPLVHCWTNQSRNNNKKCCIV